MNAITRATADELAGLVTYHAVTRYVQRVLGVEVEGHDKHPRREAERHCHAIGRTVDDIRREIMSPCVALACAMGVSEVRTRGFIAKLADNGAVLTIMVPPPRARMQVLSDRELRRKMQRNSRRAPKGGGW